MVPGELPQNIDNLSDVSSDMSNKSWDKASLDSNEIPREIREKVKIKYRNKDCIAPHYSSESDEDLLAVDLDSAFDYYEAMNPIEKLKAVKARTDALKKK